MVPVSPRAVDKRARPGNEGGVAAAGPAADLTAVWRSDDGTDDGAVTADELTPEQPARST